MIEGAWRHNRRWSFTWILRDVATELVRCTVIPLVDTTP